MSKEKNQNKVLNKTDVGGNVCCPLCGSENYEEYEELMYENGIDNPQYGGELKMVKITDCRDCG